MTKTKTFLNLIVFTAFIVILVASCKKPAGPGGRATAKGKVYARDFNNTQQYLLGEYYAPGESVYISYGSNTAVGNSVKTSTDGSFEFLYLNKGHYKVFVNSLDTSIKFKGLDKEIPVIMEFDVTTPTQAIDLGDIIINK